jgi:hypothetical protein
MSAANRGEVWVIDLGYVAKTQELGDLTSDQPVQVEGAVRTWLGL